jgi:hypothetical protein
MDRLIWLMDDKGRRFFADEVALREAFKTKLSHDDLLRFLIDDMRCVLLTEGDQCVEVCFATGAASSVALRTARDRIAVMRSRSVDIRIGYSGSPTTYLCVAAIKCSMDGNAICHNRSDAHKLKVAVE